MRKGVNSFYHCVNPFYTFGAILRKTVLTVPSLDTCVKTHFQAVLGMSRWYRPLPAPSITGAVYATISSIRCIRSIPLMIPDVDGAASIRQVVFSLSFSIPSISMVRDVSSLRRKVALSFIAEMASYMVGCCSRRFSRTYPSMDWTVRSCTIAIVFPVFCLLTGSRHKKACIHATFKRRLWKSLYRE